MDKSSHYDIVVSGAGIIGSALACAISRSEGVARPLRVALIESRETAVRDDVTLSDPRVVALNEFSRLVLEDFGIWQEVTDAGACPYHRMEVFDSDGTGRIEFDCADLGQVNLGHIVSNASISQCLRGVVARQNNIDMYCPDQISAMSHTRSDQLTLQLDGKQISTSLLIAADGSRSALRGLGNFTTREWDYGHSAMVAVLRGDKSHQHTARQWFTPAGPLALLPLSQQADENLYTAMVWSQDIARNDHLLSLNDDDFCTQLGRVSEHCMGKIQLVSARSCYPLQQCHAVDYVKGRVALIGDAAHTIHPLAGQGVNLGLKDVAVLAEELNRALDNGLDIGCKEVLLRYQRRRKPENLAVMAMMEGFKRLFERDEVPLRFLRNLGMNQLDRLTPLKNLIIKQAMGLL